MKNKNWGMVISDWGLGTGNSGMGNRLTTQNSKLKNSRPLFTICYLLFAFYLTACNRPITNSDGSMGLPILLAKPSYPIDVFFKNQTLDRNYESLGAVKVEKEVMLSTKQTTKQGRMVNRGNDEEQKRALLDQLILQGLGMGANAIINVNYKYYTAATYQGFSMEGIAVKYKKEGE